MTATQDETTVTLRGALASALATQSAALNLNSGDTSQDLKEVVESAIWPPTATETDCTVLVTAFIARVTAASAGKTVVVLRAPESDVFAARDGFSAYATVLLGFLEILDA